MTALWFILGLALIIFVSACHKYVHGRHNIIAAFYLPIMPMVIYRAARKWGHYNGTNHNPAGCWVCKEEVPVARQDPPSTRPIERPIPDQSSSVAHERELVLSKLQYWRDQGRRPPRSLVARARALGIPLLASEEG